MAFGGAKLGLEVKLDLPGLDFAETYLVPIY
jgi:hypothetical protein